MSKALTSASTPLLVLTSLLAMLLTTSGIAGSENSAAVNTAPVSEHNEVQLPGPLQAGWQGSPVCENLFEDERQRILRCNFPPGGGHDRHYHRPHVGYALLGGTMRLTDAGGVREVELPADISYSSEGVEWHEVLNIGTTTVRYLIIEEK